MSRLRRWLRNLWWARQREVDLAILWPQCKAIAPDLDHARAAFAVHAYQDPAWICHYGAKGLYDAIESLP